MQRCLFDLHADRETLRRREESTAVSPQHRFPCSPFVASTHHPPPPCRAHTWAVDESRVEDCSGSEWQLCWLIPGAARAPPSLGTISTLLQGKKSHAEIQAGSGSAFPFLLERTCSVVQLGSNLSHHYAQWNLNFPWRNLFQLIQLTHVSNKLRRDWWLSKLLHQSYDYHISNKNSKNRISRIRKSQLSFLKPRLNLCWTLIKSGIDCSNEVVPPLTTRWSANNANLDWHMF